MNAFPMTTVGDLSLSRMIIGTNWFLGWSHTSRAKDAFIRETFADYRKIADVLEVFFKAGVNTALGLVNSPLFSQAVREAEQRTGVKGIIISTPSFPTDENTPVDGFDPGEVDRILDEQVELGAAICMPHTSTTDVMVDRCTRKIRKMDIISRKIRERGMVPGLSTHLPETIIYADETGFDTETYISMYNAMGFLMTVEVDWINRVIHNAKKPVMTIKPFAAGQIRPFQGLNFVWNTLRDIDMVTVGTMTPREAVEVIEMSLGILERRHTVPELQVTRSKATLTKED